MLAFLAVVGGLAGIPAVIAHGEWNWIHHWLGEPYGGPVSEPELAEHAPSFVLIEWLLLVFGALVAFLGVWVAYSKYTRHGLEYDAVLRRRLGAGYRWAKNKYYWDEAYQRAVVGPLIRTARGGLFPFDQHIVDGAVNGAARLTRSASGALKFIQTGIVQNYALAVLLGVVVVLALILYM